MCERISRAACRPVMRGIETSITQRSGLEARACSKASTPSSASAMTLHVWLPVDQQAQGRHGRCRGRRDQDLHVAPS
jgi:hypothetical protein